MTIDSCTVVLLQHCKILMVLVSSKLDECIGFRYKMNETPTLTGIQVCFSRIQVTIFPLCTSLLFKISKKKTSKTFLLPKINLDIGSLRIKKKCINFICHPDWCHAVAIAAAVWVSLYWLSWVLTTVEWQQKRVFYKCQLIQEIRKVYEEVNLLWHRWCCKSLVIVLNWKYY